jgi:hypothetical protein
MTRVAMLNWVGSFTNVIVNSHYNVTVTAADKAGNFATQKATFSRHHADLIANTTTRVNCISTNLDVQTTGNVTGGTISVTQHGENPSGVVDHPGSSTKSAGLFVEINASQEIRDQLKQIEIKVYYDATELRAQGTEPNSLKLYWWDETQGIWSEVTPSSLGIDAAGSFIKAALIHLSKYGVFGSAIVNPPPISYGGGGGGGGPILSRIGLTGLSTTAELKVGQNGAVQTAVHLTNSDNKFVLDIPAGTILKDSAGNPLSSLSASRVATPPAAPSGDALVFAYDFGLDGASFDPPLTLTVNYDPSGLAAGSKENDLYVAWWDGNNWQAINSTVDVVAKTVSVQIAHFTQYALLSKLPAPPPATPTIEVLLTPTPAKFAIEGLSVDPASVKVGETVIVTAAVTNSGGTSGVCSIILKVNGIQEGTRDVNVDAGATAKVSFNVKRDAPGTYSIDLNSQNGQFIVSEAVVIPPPGLDTTSILIIVLLIAAAAGILAYFIIQKRKASATH